MDFLDPSKKRKNGIKLFVGYLLVGIAIGLAALILIFLSYGYSLDRKTGSVIQNGIVFVASKPADAEIFINGEKYKDNTDARLVLPSAQYKLEIRKNGYRTWQRDFYLSGGEIQRFIYPFLFPSTLTASDIDTFTIAPSMASQSPDRRWLLVQSKPRDTNFSLYDLDQDAPVSQALSLPKNLATPGTTDLSVVEWSNDNKHLLLKLTHKKGVEFIVLDRETPAKSLNVTTLTKTTADTVTLRDKKFNAWYLHVAGKRQLFVASVDTPTPKLLIKGVLDYKSYSTDVIMYATENKATKGKVRIVIWDDGRADVLREVTKSKKYLLDVTRFDNRWYFVAGAATDGKIYVYRDPFEVIRAKTPTQLIPATIMRLDNPTNVSFSQNTRFVAAQAGDTFAVYDAEAELAYRYDTSLKFAEGQKAVWMDGHRLSAVVDGKVVVFDYDGVNAQTLSDAAAGTLPYFTNNYETLYTIVPKAKSTEANLRRSSMLVN
ncbi:PEGA domain-containing protein [Candidatus Saccharibacteria bacterium]|nr:PEGA domain-containing protein [Candidatus Saccharibacteria bacterium]